ncbi:MAG: VWA domain-containing protein [Acidobacteria bacterium]|nr:VWA domain-containing protein [Acidobacteriota bacterium]
MSVTAVVRDRRGRVVRNLDAKDFLVFDKGRRRPIVEFSANEAGPVSVAILFDVSGSMDVGRKLLAAREAAGHVLNSMRPGTDEAALFTFDTHLQELEPFTTKTVKLQHALQRIQPFGATSLYDAVAQTANRVAERATKRRAVIVLTDGVDTSSRFSASQVSGMASSIDVPVYLMVVVSPLDHVGTRGSVVSPARSPLTTGLADLARWTGGDLFVVSVPAHASISARQLMSELRHQYLIAFEAAREPGWHPLEIRIRERDLVVRTRSGYVAG